VEPFSAPRIAATASGIVVLTEADPAIVLRTLEVNVRGIGSLRHLIAADPIDFALSVGLHVRQMFIPCATL